MQRVVLLSTLGYEIQTEREVPPSHDSSSHLSDGGNEWPLNPGGTLSVYVIGKTVASPRIYYVKQHSFWVLNTKYAFSQLFLSWEENWIQRFVKNKISRHKGCIPEKGGARVIERCSPTHLVGHGHKRLPTRPPVEHEATGEWTRRACGYWQSHRQQHDAKRPQVCSDLPGHLKTPKNRWRFLFFFLFFFCNW